MFLQVYFNGFILLKAQLHLINVVSVKYLELNIILV